jgi:hypothetical protein
MFKRFQILFIGVNRLSVLTSQPSINIPPSSFHILCESYNVSIEVIRINLIGNLYFANESADVLTADIDVD